jgi:hypothetical protein
VEGAAAEVSMSNQDKKNKSIAEAVKAIHKQFGSGSIMRLDGSEVQQVEVIPTGSLGSFLVFTISLSRGLSCPLNMDETFLKSKANAIPTRRLKRIQRIKGSISLIVSTNTYFNSSS